MSRCYGKWKMILGFCRGGVDGLNLTGFTFIGGRNRRRWRVKAHAAAAVTVWATAAFFRQPTTAGPTGYCRSPQYETNAARMDFIGALSHRESLVKASGIDSLQLPMDLGDGRPRSCAQRAVQIELPDAATSPRGFGASARARFRCNRWRGRIRSRHVTP